MHLAGPNRAVLWSDSPDMICQHAWASFGADFPEAPDAEETRCEALGEFLAAGLRRRGITVEGTDCWRDCGWQVNCRISGKAVYFFVSYIGQGPVQYVLCCTSDRGLWGWLTRRDDSAERWRLVQAVHEVLIPDSPFNDIRWYVERGWAAGAEDKWVPEPV
jgi:hypothetical protein